MDEGSSQVSIIVSGGVVMTMNKRGEVFLDGAVAIAGTDVVAVGKRSVIEEAYRADKVIDASDCIVIPGLINTHTHTFQNLYKGLGDDMPVLEWVAEMIFPLSENLRSKHAYVGAQLSCLEMIKGGVTCFSDSFYIHRDTRSIYEVARAVEGSGMRAVLARACVDQGVPDRFQESPAVAVERTEAAVKDVNGRGDGRVQVCPEALFTLFSSPELIGGLKDISKRYGVQFHMHAGESAAEAQEIRRQTGKTIFSYLDSIDALGSEVLLAHAVWSTESDMKIMSERLTSVSHNPVSNQYLASGVCPVPRMREFGINVGLGTDGAASNNTQDMFEVMKSAALLQKVTHLDARALVSEDVVSMATRGGARALGLEGQIGSLEPGKRADVVVVRLDEAHSVPALKPVSTLVYCSRCTDVSTVLIDGRIVMEDRKMKLVDEDEILARGRETAEQLVHAAGKTELLETGAFTYLA